MRIVFSGDSTFFGEGVDIAHTFVAKLAVQLRNRFGDIIVSNPSMIEHTTRSALERASLAIQKPEPGVVLLQYGANDCARLEGCKGLPQVSPAAFQANLHEMLDRAKRFGCKHGFLVTNHPTMRTDTIEGKAQEQGRRHYNKLMREVAAIRKGETTLLDMEAVFDQFMVKGASLVSLLLPDKINLSVEGHRIYFENTISTISSVLTALK